MKRDKRNDRYQADTIKTSRKPLSAVQKQALAIMSKQAKVRTRSELDDKAFRQSVIEDATVDHWAGQVSGLSQATRQHYDVIAAAFLLLLGKTAEAMEHLMKDDPKKQRSALLRHLVDAELAKLPSLRADATPEEVRAEQLKWGNTFCQNVWHCDLEHADDGQLDFLLRKMRPAIADKVRVINGALAAAAKPAPLPEPERPLRHLRRFVPMGAEARHLELMES